MKAKALQLAEELEARGFLGTTAHDAATELRRLHNELQQWKSVFGHLGTADECGNEWIKVIEQRDELLSIVKRYVDCGLSTSLVKDTRNCIAKFEGELN